MERCREKSRDPSKKICIYVTQAMDKDNIENNMFDWQHLDIYKGVSRHYGLV